MSGPFNGQKASSKTPNMSEPKFSLTAPDDELRDLVGQSDHRVLGSWARDCASRVLALFEVEFPDDKQPRQALETLQNWVDTGQFNMSVIRSASLSAHAAAREVGEDSPARSAARAAGQAVATAHVPTHALGAAKYAQQAVFRASAPEEALEAAAQERDRQFTQLMQLNQERQI